MSVPSKMSATPKIQHSLSRILFYEDDDEAINSTVQSDSKRDKYMSDSMSELGQIAILSNSRASLRYQPRRRMTTSPGNARSESFRLVDDKEHLEKEIVDIETTDSGCMATLVKIKGSILGIMAALMFVSSNVVMKKSIHLSPTDHSAIRYTLTFIIMVIICKYNKIKILGPRKFFKLLLIRGFLGSIALMSFYFAILFLTPSDAVTLVHSSIIITAILSRIFLGEKLTLAHFLAVFLTFNGVLFISKPDFIFKRESLENSSSYNMTTNPDESSLESLKPMLGNYLKLFSRSACIFDSSFLKKGIFFALVCATSTSNVYLILKKLTNAKVHWATSIIYVCWAGLPLSIIISILLVYQGSYHKNFDLERDDFPMDIYYSMLSASFSLGGQILLTLAFFYEDATKLAVLRTTDVFFACLLQYFMLGVVIDYLTIIGSCSILLATFTILSFKIMQDRYDDYKVSQQAKNDTGNSNLKAEKDTNENGENSETNTSCCLDLIFFKV